MDLFSLILVSLIGLLLVSLLVLRLFQRITGKRSDKDLTLTVVTSETVKLELKQRFWESVHDTYALIPVVRSVQDIFVHQYKVVGIDSMRLIKERSAKSSTLLLLLGIVGISVTFNFSETFSGRIIFVMSFLMLISMYLDNISYKTQKVFLHDLKSFIEDLKDEYAKHRMITIAFFNCSLKPRGSFTDFSIKLYNLFEGSVTKSRVENFLLLAPTDQLKQVVEQAYLVYEYDDTLDRDGASNFSKTMDVVLTSLRDEILKREKLMNAMSGTMAVALIGAFVPGPLKNFTLNSFDQVKEFFEMNISVYLDIVMFLSLIITFIYLRLLKNTLISTTYLVYESTIYEKLLRVKWINRLMTRIVPPKEESDYSEILHLKTIKILSDSYSTLTVKQFFLKRVLLSVLTFVLSITLVFVIHSELRDKLLSSTLGNIIFLTESEIQSLRDYEDSILEELGKGDTTYEAYIANEKLRAEGGLGDPTLVRISEETRDRYVLLGYNDQLSYVKDLYTKANTLGQQKVSWWEILLCLGAAILAYWSSVILAKMKSKKIRESLDNEIDNLSTILEGLSKQPSMMVKTMLESMHRYSQILKPYLSLCLVEYDSQPHKSLDNLMLNCPYPRFINCVERLKKCIDSLDVEKAFDDVSAERMFNRELRLMHLENTVESHRNSSRAWSQTPLFVALCLYMLLPFSYFFVQMFLNIFSSDMMSKLDSM